MPEQLYCWKCSEPLVGVIFPMSRREECAHCDADQHVCKLCQFYNAAVSDCCTEDRAESVTDKEQANFCDYFEPRPGVSGKQKAQDEAQTRAALAELFGEEPAPGPDSETEAAPVMSESEAALSALNDLFNKE